MEPALSDQHARQKEPAVPSANHNVRERNVEMTDAGGCVDFASVKPSASAAPARTFSLHATPLVRGRTAERMAAEEAVGNAHKEWTAMKISSVFPRPCALQTVPGKTAERMDVAESVARVPMDLSAAPTVPARLMAEEVEAASPTVLANNAVKTAAAASVALALLPKNAMGLGSVRS